MLCFSTSCFQYIAPSLYRFGAMMQSNVARPIVTYLEGSGYTRDYCCNLVVRQTQVQHEKFDMLLHAGLGQHVSLIHCSVSFTYCSLAIISGRLHNPLPLHSRGTLGSNKKLDPLLHNYTLGHMQTCHM